MALKERLRNNCIYILICMCTLSCSKSNKDNAVNVFEKVDVSQIPNTTILENDKLLKINNGVCYFSNKPFSGFIISSYKTDTLKTIASFFKGKQHGVTKTFFPNGKLETERNYKNGIGYGRHIGYWANGLLKFDFTYFNDKREGFQKQWYQSGSPYYELNYTDDKENGMQKAWRENGKPYINYEARNGERYGLQKSALCYTLKDGQLK